MRPTGRLHIGHYFGALQNWVRLQNDPAYECFYFIADWHALTSDYADTPAVAGARTHVQRGAGERQEQRSAYLRISGLSDFADCGYRDLQRIGIITLCARWRGSGFSRRVQPGAGKAFQYTVWS